MISIFIFTSTVFCFNVRIVILIDLNNISSIETFHTNFVNVDFYDFSKHFMLQYISITIVQEQRIR